METELRQILAEIAIESVAMFRLRGDPVAVQPGYMAALPGFPTHPVPAMPLVRDLQGALYARCYSRDFRAPQSAGRPMPTADPSFVNALSARNHSRARWESGWTIYAAAQNGQISIIKGDRQRSAAPGEFITNAPGSPLRPGTAVSILVPRESSAMQPGFYFAFGETLSDVWDDGMLLRLYFHATAGNALDLVGYLTRQLNRHLVPFRLKALNDPALYDRADAVVLYAARRFYRIATRIVQTMPHALGAALNPRTPLFTRSARPGVGLAEEPGTGESFGMHRCRLVAEGTVRAWLSGDQSVDGRLRAVRAQFGAAGFDLDRPHLNPGSTEFDSVPERVDYECA